MENNNFEFFAKPEFTGKIIYPEIERIKLLSTHVKGKKYDPYNHGLINGLILSLKTLGCDDIEFLKAEDYE